MKIKEGSVLIEKLGGISSDAVRLKTGKTWNDWCQVLDAAGAVRMKHSDIARLVDETVPEIGGWWSQMVTVGYEQARGLREKHQKPSGYEISVSKTMDVPLKKLYEAWSNARLRGRWLSEKALVVRKATEGKSMRITWVDRKTTVAVNFYSKGSGKSQVVVQHGKLKSDTDAGRMKSYWTGRLEKLKEQLES